MIKDTLNVGCKIGTEKYAVTVQLRYPETDADVAELSKTEAFRVKMFTRGWAIWNQEQSGARDIVEAATKAERDERKGLTAKVQACIDAADPSAPPKRSGRTAAPVEVKVDDKMKAAMKKGDLAALQAMLLAAGVKGVTFSQSDADATQIKE